MYILKARTPCQTKQALPDIDVGSSRRERLDKRSLQARKAWVWRIAVDRLHVWLLQRNRPPDSGKADCLRDQRLLASSGSGQKADMHKVK
jgi:hypothetical protein